MNFISLKPINFDEKFPQLTKAPIAEAVIDLQVFSLPSWDETNIKQQLAKRLSHYSKIEEQREFNVTFTAKQQHPTPKDLGCVGFRAISNDGFYIAQFNRRGFTLSRVKKYEKWTLFCEEAQKLWNLYRDLLKPEKLKRVGVRYINRLLADYQSRDFLAAFKNAPQAKQIAGWSLENFLHRDVLKIPNTDYTINLIKTIVSEPAKQGEVAAVLDSDIFYAREVSCEWNDIEKHLKVMRWAKNKIFFESITKKKIKEYK